MTTIKALFWISIASIGYSYFVYPLLLKLAARLFGQQTTETPDIPRDELPFVSMVIAAYREEAVILERLNNIALLDYPSDRLEVIIGVDGNEDMTGDVIRNFADPRVRLQQFPKRRGKASVLNDCVPEARGEIIVFSDANTNMSPDAILQLVKHFADPKVGGVCGQLVLTDPETGKNVDGVYWRYENFLKRTEAKIGGLLGVNGAIYALRRELYEPIPSHTIVDDFLIGMRVHLKGLRLVYEPNAQAFEETAPSIQGEYHRRTRIGAGNFQSLQWLWPLLNPMRGAVSFSFFSHKLMRWLCPVFMLVALCCNIALVRESPFEFLLAIQVAFYMCALIGWQLHAGQGWRKVVRISTMFVAMNVALFVGFFRWIATDLKGTWKRTERGSEAELEKEAVSQS